LKTKQPPSIDSLNQNYDGSRLWQSGNSSRRRSETGLYDSNVPTAASYYPVPLPKNYDLEFTEEFKLDQEKYKSDVEAFKNDSVV
jgi:hypothetical protein